MTDRRTAFAQAAETLLGCPFRLHGRDPLSGLDCVGVVMASLQLIGSNPADAVGYGFRNRDYRPYLKLIGTAGFSPHCGPLKTGDLLATVPGPAQLHLLTCATDGGLIHAHAGLGRVVKSPFPITDPLVGQWHLTHN
jgi:hypothetical protein